LEKTQKELQSEQTRARIIECAMRLFARKGFYATSIADLAEAVEMTKGALYHHFESKEGLFSAVIETIRGTWREEVGRMVLKEKDALSRLHALLDSQARLIEKNDSFCLVLNTLMTEMEDVNPKFLVRLQTIYSDLVSFVEQIIMKGQTDGQIRSDLDARVTAVGLVGILRGTGCSRPIFERLKVDYRELTEAVGRVILAGLEP
jgi:AcrR family transcriptional regulator